jgi:hypothetical protein
VSLGDFRLKTEAGTIKGAPAAAAAVFRNSRRDRLLFFFDKDIIPPKSYPVFAKQTYHDKNNIVNFS